MMELIHWAAVAPPTIYSLVRRGFDESRVGVAR